MEGYGRKIIITPAPAYPTSCVYCGHGYDECTCDFSRNTLEDKDEKKGVVEFVHEPGSQQDIEHRIVERLEEIIGLLEKL